MNTQNRTIRTLFWSFMEQGSTKATAMLVQIVLARILLPEDFGVLAILLVVTQVADAIAQSGLGMALIQTDNIDAESYDTAFCLSIGIALVLYILLFFGAPILGKFYSMPNLEAYLRILGIVVFFNSTNSIQRSYMQRLMNFKGLFKISLSAVIVGGIVGIAIAMTGFGVWSLVIQTLVQSIATCIAMAFVVPWHPRLHFSIDVAKNLYSYGWKVCITGILNVLYNGISELVIGHSCSATDLGYYSQGRKYPVAAISVMTNSIANVLFPAFSRVSNDAEALRSEIKKSLDLGTWIVVPVSVGCALIAEPLVILLLTEKWLPCAFIFRLTCLSNALLLFQLVNLRAYMAIGRSDIYLYLQIIKVFFGGGIICTTAALTHDIYATAFVTFLASIISIIFVDMQPAKRLLGYSWTRQLIDEFPVYLVSVVAAIFALVVSKVNLPIVHKMIIQLVVFVVVYIAGTRVVRPDLIVTAGAVIRRTSKDDGKS